MQFNYYNLKQRTLALKDNIIVPVIASYNSAGHCSPLYFRYSTETGETHTIKIDKVISFKPNSIFGLIYDCRITLENQQMTIRLFHHEQEHKWYLRL